MNSLTCTLFPMPHFTVNFPVGFLLLSLPPIDYTLEKAFLSLQAQFMLHSKVVVFPEGGSIYLFDSGVLLLIMLIPFR